MNLSVVIATRNEASEITDCLKSVTALADEIILVDNGSTDNTAKIAQSGSAGGVKVFPHANDPLHLNVSKNFGFTKAHGKWILSLDADERVSRALAQQIKSAIKNPRHSAYMFPRQNIIFGQWIQHGLWYPDYQTRLFQADKAKFPGVHNHEKLQVDGDTGRLSGHLVHYNYRTVSQYIRKINDVYSDNEVATFIKSGKTVYWYDAIRMPFADFLTNFFAREAYKDGLHGLVLSLLQAFYTFVVFAKIWEKQNFPAYNSDKFILEVHQELRAKTKEYNYWRGQRQGLIAALLHKLLNSFS